MRGAILDRFGEVFAETMATSSIYASPRKYPVAAEVRPALAKALGISPRVLDRKLDAPRGFVWLKRRVPHDEARAVSQLAILGVGPVTEGRRVYPQGPVGAHVVGFSGSDLRGLEGIELRYDRWMRGPETVLRMQRDGLGRALMIAEDEGDDVAPLGADHDRRRLLKRRACPAGDVRRREGLAERSDLVVALAVRLEDQPADDRRGGGAAQDGQAAPAEVGVQRVVAALGDDDAAVARAGEGAGRENRRAAAAHLLSAVGVADHVADGLAEQRDHRRSAPTAR